MSDALLDASPAAIPIELVAEGALGEALEAQDGRAWGGQAAGLAEAEGFKAKAGQALKLPGADGKLARVLLGLGAQAKAETFRIAAGRLPAGDYRLESVPEGLDPTDVATAWGLGTYRYDRYKPAKEGPARLVLPEGVRGEEARAVVHACALALGRMVMALGLKARLHVLVPVVENAISGDAMRPGDVIASRKGLTIEIGNTDAEGRLILADALARAGELNPVLTLDMATLTGAARVALGPQVIPFFTPDDALAADIDQASLDASDPLWRLPLWAGYDEAVDSDIADLKNDPDGWAQAGAMTAALFLKRFAPDSGAWAHLDIFAWNPKGRPGWAVGGEAQAVRALFHLLQARFAPTVRS